MAKTTEAISLADLIKGLENSNLKMNASVKAQLKSIQEQERIAKADEKLQTIQTIESVKIEKDELDLKKEIKQGLLDTSGTGLNSNVILLTKHIITSNKLLKELSIGVISNFKKTKADPKKVDLTEEDINQQKHQETLINLLHSIDKNTKPTEEEKEKETKNELGSIGVGLTAFAAILGASVAYFNVHIKAIKMLSSAFYKGLIKLSDFFPALKKVLFTIEMNFAMAAEYIKTTFNSFVNRVGKIFGLAADTLKKLFTFSNNSFIGKSIAAIKSGLSSLSNFFAPIGDVLSDIKKYSAPIGKLVSSIKTKIAAFFEFFAGVGKSLGIFSKMFTAIKIISEKIAWPIMVIMGLYEGIVGAIEGFEAEGILGGIKGFISGVLNSVVGSFLDLIKGMASWALGALGFDEAEKFLDSFSFSDIIKNLIDAIFKPIELVKDMFMSLYDWVNSFKLPEFELFGIKFGGSDDGKKPPTIPTSNNSKTDDASGTLKGVTGEQITSHPNYKKYFNEAKEEIPGTSDITAHEVATMSVKDDMIKAQSSAAKQITPSAANKVYSDSAKVDAANKQPAVAQKASTIVSAPTQINNQTQNTLVKPNVRNNDNTVNSYLKSRFA